MFSCEPREHHRALEVHVQNGIQFRPTCAPMHVFGAQIILPNVLGPCGLLEDPSSSHLEIKWVL